MLTLQGKMIIQKEERLLINILFNSHKLSKSNFENINYEKFVRLTSAHLLIPLIYYKLKSYNFLNLIPIDLKKFIKYIYVENLSRNKCLKKEINYLEKTLKKNKIKYRLIKGAAMIKNNIFDCIGIRMVGDIDILIDKGQIEKCYNILKNDGYANRYNYRFWKTRHIPKMSNKNKLFAIELHSEALKIGKHKTLSADEIFSDKNLKKVMKKICYLNFFINDEALLRANYNYRFIYDLYKLSDGFKKYSLSVSENKYEKKIKILTNQLGITNFRLTKDFFEKIYIWRLSKKKESKIVFLIDSFFCEAILKPKIYFHQLIEFSANKKYRKNVMIKLTGKN